MRHFLRGLLPGTLLVSLCLVPAVHAQTPAAGGETAPAIGVGTARGPVRLDGVLDEDAWTSAPAIDGLTMIEPDHDIPESHRTVVKVLVRPTEIYVGVTCDDEIGRAHV